MSQLLFEQKTKVRSTDTKIDTLDRRNVSSTQISSGTERQSEEADICYNAQDEYSQAKREINSYVRQ